MPKKRSINDINKRTSSQFAPMQQNQTAQDFSRNAQVYHAAATKGNKRKKTLTIVLSAVLVVLLTAGVAFALYLADVSNRLNRGDKSDDELMAINEALRYKSNFNEVFYMLLVGSDARHQNEMSRSDVNIVARVDPINNEVSLLSIPRDTKIDIKGHGTQKFNAAYAFDKIPGVIQATEDLLDVPISHYAEVNFSGLKDIVNAVGGVTVDVEGRVDDRNCDDGDGNHYVLEEGEQRLNGGQALTYARSRHAFAAGDFARASHQRQIIEAIVTEVTNAPITKIPSIVEASVSCVTTDIGIMDIIGLAQQFADADEIKMYSAMVPSYTQMINGISFVITDQKTLEEMLVKFKNGEDCSEIFSVISSAPAITDRKIDTSNTLVFVDDDEVEQGTAKPNTSTVTAPDSGSTGGATGGSDTGSTTPDHGGGTAGGGADTGGGSSGGGADAGGGSSGGGDSGGSSGAGGDSGGAEPAPAAA